MEHYSLMERKLDNWIESYLHYTRHDESPEQFHKWTAYTVLAAAVNRNCWMDRGYYKVFSNLYVLFIGPSGVGKSSSSGIGVELLRETSLKVNIYKDFITPPALISFMSRSAVSQEHQLGERTVITHKTPLLLYASELGNLLSVRSGVRELTLLLTELFNKPGDHEDTTNIRGTIKIKKPSVTFLGCCFPEWIDEELTSISLRSGFLGRMLVVSGSMKRHRAPNITQTPEDLILKETLKHDLEIIGALYGPMRWGTVAKKVWTDWYNSLPIDMAADGMEISGFSSRKAQFVQRLAMLTAISRNNPKLVVEEGDLHTAQKMVSYCEQNIKNMGAESEEYKLIKKIKRNLAAYAKKVSGVEIELQKLMPRVSKWVSKRRLEELLDQLALEGFVELRGRKLTIVGPFEETESVQKTNK